MFVLIADKNFVERVGYKREDTNPIIRLVVALGLRLVDLIECPEVLQTDHRNCSIADRHTGIHPGRGGGESL